MRYPTTRTVDAHENVAGLTLPDPYRWLEDQSAEVRDWQRAQARLASSYIREWPHYPAVGELVRKYAAALWPTVPRFAGGRWFRSDTEPGRAPRVVAAAEPFGAGQVVADLADLAGDEGEPILSWLAPAPDGTILAIGVCMDGSDRNHIRLIDMPGGEYRADAPPHLLNDGWTGGVSWLPDSSGFYYVALVGDPDDYRQAVFFQRLGSSPPARPEPVPLPGESLQSVLVQVSADGRWAVVVHGWGDARPVAVADLADPSAGWRPFVAKTPGTVAGHIIDGHYVAVTDIGASRGRIVAIDLNAADPDDPSGWTELAPESDVVLRSITPVGDLLYGIEYVDTYSRVRIMDRSGRTVGHVPLPADGAVGEPPFASLSLVARGHPDEFVFAFSTLVRSWAVYRHRPGAAAIELLRPADATIEGATTEDRWATSRDGTRVPYHVVRPAGADPSRPAPTLVYAYGGMYAPWIPGFPGAMAAFVEAGGVFVHAHLRGGGEFGRAWREAGRYDKKQNCYDDLYAVAEALIADGVTTTELLGLTGTSNGGLMTGVAVTQRPDLWKVAVPRVPMLDLVGGLRTPYTRVTTREDRGEPTNPDDVRRLSTFSPYERVENGTAYPAIFVVGGDTDPRCPPWHARKWAARMQAAQAGAAPILLHIWENTGHGPVAPDETTLTENAEWLSFVCRQLDMRP